MQSHPNVFDARPAHWSAVFSLFLGVTSLIAGEWLPISLLTPIARDLGITEGMAGQTVSVVGAFAVVTSLLLAPLTQGINRRRILLTLSSLLVASNLIVAIAPNYAILLIGRALLGICVGGFWSMSAAVALQLVPVSAVPRALSIIYGGVAAATVISLPVASSLGNLLGWRAVFGLGAILAVAALVWQWIALPPLRPGKASSFSSMFGLLRQNWVLLGILATIFSFGGYNMFFTYLRPFLERTLALSPSQLSAVLGVFGLANCVGTFGAGMLFERRFRGCMILLQTVLALTAIVLSFTDGALWTNLLLILMWGVFWGFMPVGWSTWITRTLADHAELAGGLSVAAIQFAIGSAAGIGGVIVDTSGINTIFWAAAGLFVLAAVLTRISFALYFSHTGRRA
jgi:predicted MFS family arabinose efflux permease